MKKNILNHFTIILLVMIIASTFTQCKEEDEDNMAMLGILGLATTDPTTDPVCGDAGASCIIFVTDSTYNGNLSGISGADTKCNNDANKPNTSTYKAMIVDGTNRDAEAGAQVDWVLKANTKYVRADGTTEIFTTNADHIFDFSIADATNSVAATSAPVWTGLINDWTFSGESCNDWADNGTGIVGWLGNTGLTNGSLIMDGFPQMTWTCDYTYNLYCVEQ